MQWQMGMLRTVWALLEDTGKPRGPVSVQWWQYFQTDILYTVRTAQEAQHT